MNNQEFNYVIGYNPPGEEGHYLETYGYHQEVFYGNLKEAKACLSYVRRKSPSEDWKIFMLVEI